MDDQRKETNGGYGDYTQPIARTGEPQYACVMRERSGIDAGMLDFGLRDLTHMGDGGQSAVNTIYALYLAACDQTGLTSTRPQLPAADGVDAPDWCDAKFAWEALDAICTDPDLCSKDLMKARDAAGRVYVAIASRQGVEP